MIIDTMIGLFIFALGAAAFYGLMPILKQGETISRYESVATQMCSRMVEHLQTFRPSDLTAEALSQLNLIDDGQVGSPYSFSNVPMDHASRYSPSQALPNGTGTLTVTPIESGCLRLDVEVTWRSPTGRTSRVRTGTILGGYR